MAFVLAMAFVSFQGFGVKGFLLLWVQSGIKRFGCLAALVHRRLAFGVHRLHGVDTLGRGHLGKGLAVGALTRGRALALGCRNVVVPGAFLAGVDLQFCL